MDNDANYDPDNDVVDDPDFLRRISRETAGEARGPQQVRQPPPESEALQQMLSEALNREMILRAELVRLRRAAPG
jgi:hypothetical protein